MPKSTAETDYPLVSVLPLTVTGEATEPIVLPEYSGSTIRGAFGWSLKEAVCVTDHGDCDRCFLSQNCLFPRTFETQHLNNDNGHYSSYSHPPKAFTLRPPTKNEIDPGEMFEFELTIFGRPAKKGPYWLHTLQTISKNGLGPKRGQFEVQLVQTFDDKVVFKNGEMLEEPSPESSGDHQTSGQGDFTLTFNTPARLSGEDGLASKPDPETLMRNLMRRQAVLAYFHDGTYWEDVPFNSLLEEARSWRMIANNTEWKDWERYSERRDEAMKLGGLIGSVSYRGSVELTSPLLQWGQWTHIGKNTTFGLGAYDFEWT